MTSSQFCCDWKLFSILVVDMPKQMFPLSEFRVLSTWMIAYYIGEYARNILTVNQSLSRAFTVTELRAAKWNLFVILWPF
jgi:nitrate/nitrite transporter NarK